MSGYTKLFSSIVGSTIWSESYETKIVWITLLAMSDKDGFVEASIPGLAHLARVPLDGTVEALRVLSSPDEFSRSPEHEGRRIEAISGGWFIFNRAKYRDQTGPEDRKEYMREKQAESRLRRSTTTTTPVATSSVLVVGYVYYVAKGNFVKIAFSRNPWARFTEAKAHFSGAILLAIESGDTGTEASRKEQFANLLHEGDLYRRSDKLMAFISGLPAARGAGVPPTAGLSTTSNKEEEEKEVSKDNSLRSLSARPEGLCDDDQDSSIPAEALAAYEQAERNETTQEMVLESDDKPDSRKFPWAQVEAAMNRITPELKMRSKAERRDQRMKNFWRDHGKTVGAFELLATKVQESDFLMARNGSKGHNDTGRPYPWSWIFDKDGRSGQLRSDRVMADFYANERINGIRESIAAKVSGPNKQEVTIAGEKNSEWIDLNERHPDGTLVWKKNGVVNTYSGTPEVERTKND